MNSYYKEVQSLLKDFPNMALGDAHMAVLKLRRPDLYTYYLGSELDPSKDIRNFERFKQSLQRRWGCNQVTSMNKREEKPEVININLTLDWPFF
jgi:hypothetical protein